MGGARRVPAAKVLAGCFAPRHTGGVLGFLRKLLAYVRPYRGRMALGILAGVGFGLCNAALMLVVKVVVDWVFPGSGAPSLEVQLAKAPAALRAVADRLLPMLPSSSTPSTAGIVVAVLTIPAVMLVRSCCAYLNYYLLHWVAVRAMMDLRTRLFGHLQGLSLAFFHNTSTGELISRISNDTMQLHRTVSNTLPVMVKSPIAIAALLIVLLSQQPKLTLIALVVTPLAAVPIAVCGRKVRKSTEAVQENLADLTDQMAEAFTGNRVVKAYNLEPVLLTKFRDTTARYIGQFMRIVRASEIPGVVMEFLGAVGVALLLLYVALVTRSTPGDFFQFVLGIFAMYQPIKELGRLPGQLQQARAATRRVFELLDITPTVREPAQPKPLAAAGAEIQFENIDFDYDSKPALRGVNLTVKPGQVVALVGASGAGKTTLTNLLLRFFDPQRGAVRIGGVDVRDVSLRDLRDQIALVTQETIFFNDTVRRNIELGRVGARNSEVEDAARHAHAHEFIAEKPQGYDTIIGERGVMLSGGQRQRLAIARAILKNAPILVLDEATNALDTESERHVQSALEDLMKGRTSICIAHRLVTIQRADLIVVMDQGRIVQAGTHAELMEQGGVYRKLHQLQFQA
jgi:subfamily B ATP-binding cassette protein MsbA